ncbi:uncharacterized protein [Heterodontus francisci]|uniref:uncharacterized protein n=1 Tax=Heterodontus francisci TaxID=7792 RepID=UPI00355C275C
MALRKVPAEISASQDSQSDSDEMPPLPMHALSKRHQLKPDSQLRGLHKVFRDEDAQEDHIRRRISARRANIRKRLAEESEHSLLLDQIEGYSGPSLEERETKQWPGNISGAHPSISEEEEGTSEGAASHPFPAPSTSSDTVTSVDWLHLWICGHKLLPAPHKCRTSFQRQYRPVPLTIGGLREARPVLSPMADDEPLRTSIRQEMLQVQCEVYGDLAELPEMMRALAWTLEVSLQVVSSAQSLSSADISTSESQGERVVLRLLRVTSTCRGLHGFGQPEDARQGHPKPRCILNSHLPLP